MSETREKVIEFLPHDLKNSSKMNPMKDEAVFPEQSMADVSPQDDASYEFLEFISMDSSQTDKSGSDEDTLPELEEVESKPNSHDKCTDAVSTISIDSKKSLAHVELKSIETEQTSASEMQSVSTETELISTCAETQTQISATQTGAIPKGSKNTGNVQENIVLASSKEKMTLERCSIRSAILQRNIDDHMKKAKELSDAFISTQSRYAEEQNIIGECANMINAVESIKLADDKSLAGHDLTEYEKSLTNYRKKLISVQIQVVEDRQKMISVEKHYQKMLSDYRRLVLELESVQLENAKMILIEKEKQKKYAAIERSLDERDRQLNEEKASLIKQQQSLIDEKALVYEAMMSSIQTLELEKEKLLVGRQFLKDVVNPADRSEPMSLDLKKSILKKKVYIQEQQALQQQINAAHQQASMSMQQQTVTVMAAPQIKVSGVNQSMASQVPQTVMTSQALSAQHKPQEAQQAQNTGPGIKAPQQAKAQRKAPPGFNNNAPGHANSIHTHLQEQLLRLQGQLFELRERQKHQTDPSVSASQSSAPASKGQINSVARKSATNFVTCEICDVPIEDPEQLRNHMQWVHKFKIHPKMIYSKPPLNCQKCKFRFYTDQGLERHLLGSHGLVTSTMQEAANSGKDGGRCPACGRVCPSKLLAHVARDHGMTLKPAHLTYRCTVCTATFGVYERFENHVYSAHSGVAKQAMDKKNGGPCALSSRSSD